ncbi:hypothetical protein MTR67_020989, partial [Solanum verrucosum]
ISSKEFIFFNFHLQICVDRSLIYVLDMDMPLFCIGTVISRTNGLTVRYEHRGASDLFVLHKFVEVGANVSATEVLSPRLFNLCSQEIYW